MPSTPIAFAGIGKIAKDEHIPALEASKDWHLAATISRNDGIDGVPGFHDMDAFLRDPGDIRTVSLALPPGPRFDYAIKAMRAGMNVMLEKPPSVTLGAARHLCMEAEANDVSLYFTWHSRMGDACDAARDRLKGKTLKKLKITWCEDVRQTHPDQDWLWEPGNLGVYDRASTLSLSLPRSSTVLLPSRKSRWSCPTDARRRSVRTSCSHIRTSQT